MIFSRCQNNLLPAFLCFFRFFEIRHQMTKRPIPIYSKYFDKKNEKKKKPLKNILTNFMCWNNANFCELYKSTKTDKWLSFLFLSVFIIPIINDSEWLNLNGMVSFVGWQRFALELILFAFTGNPCCSFFFLEDAIYIRNWQIKW